MIYDVENKGMACCSVYTIKQLIEHGHVVHGITLTPKTVIVPVTKSGEPRKKTEVYDIPLTKRSATTIEKGLKPLRSELKAQKEKAAKASKTRKANAKAKKEAEKALEKQKKEELEAEKRKKKALEVKCSKRQKSKVLAELRIITLTGAEYKCEERMQYRLIANSPASLTQMRKLSKAMSKHGEGFFIKDDAGEQLRRYGRYTTDITTRMGLDCFNSDANIQFCASDNVELLYENYYTDVRVCATFNRYSHYVPKLSDSRGFYDSDFSRKIGSVAYGEHSLNGYARMLRNLGYVTN